jgi:tetratricopeptide (TPR) repeat protein
MISPDLFYQNYSVLGGTVFGEAYTQSLDGARYSAIESAKLEILEYAGTYMESHLELINGKLTKDEILAISNGVINTKVLDEKRVIEGNAIAIIITIECELETNGLKARINNLINDRTLKAQNEDLLHIKQKLLSKINALEERAKENENENEKIQLNNEFRLLDKKVKAVEYLNESKQYYSMKNKKWHCDNPKKVIELTTKAILLDPSLHSAYYLRGGEYFDSQKNYSQALADYTKAISLDSKDMTKYFHRGIAYLKLKNYKMALKDFNKAIQLDPTFGRAYGGRGIIYIKTNQEKQGCEDIHKFAELDPVNGLAFSFMITVKGGYCSE